MGISDRTYYRDDEQSSWLGNRSMVVNLILLNAAVYLVQLFLGKPFTIALGLNTDLFHEPWHFYQLLTYGFLHDPDKILHILGNMFFLWMCGTDIEQIYGRAEFLRFYLATIVIAGLVWVAVTALGPPGPPLVGASGGVMGVMILFVMHFPRRIFLFWGIIPVPAWALGAMYIVFDIFGAAHPTDNVAHVAHLSGVAFGFLYYRTGMNLGRLQPKRFSGAMFRLRPRLKLHDPEAASRDLNDQVDTILAKISQHGEASLTKKERRTLEEASRRYQRRRQ